MTATGRWRVTWPDDSGWSVYNRYGVVMLYDPLQLFKEQRHRSHAHLRDVHLAKTQMDQERTLLEFDPTEESESTVEQQGLQGRLLQRRPLCRWPIRRATHSSYRFLSDFVIRNAEEAATVRQQRGQ